MSAHAMKAAVLVSYGMDFRVTDVLRPQPGRGEVLVRIAASGLNPLDTKIFDGAAAHARHAPRDSLGATSGGRRGVAKPSFNFNLDGEENDYVARSTCN
jgi:NADPH:quinone reductase